jgi:hypothetical protein
MSATVIETPDYIRGDAWDITVTIPKANDPSKPFDLTNGAVLFTLKDARDIANNDEDAICALSWQDGETANGVAVADPTTGVAVITVPESATALLEDRRYKYDVTVINAAGQPKTVVIVHFTPAMDVTKRNAP